MQMRSKFAVFGREMFVSMEPEIPSLGLVGGAKGIKRVAEHNRPFFD